MGRDIDKDLKDTEKNDERDRQKDRNPEKEERKISKNVEKMSDNDIRSSAKEILDKREDSKTREPLSSRERLILERSSKLDKQKIDDNRHQCSDIKNRVDAHHPQKGDIKKIATLDREYNELKNQLQRTRDTLNPKRAEARESFSRNEKDQDLVQRVENGKTVAIDKGKIYSMQPQKENNRWTNRDSVNMALDIAKYQAITGRDVHNSTKSEISRMKIKSMDERQVPKFELERIATSKHPEAIRTFYEFGLRVGDEKLKPDQLNNAVKLLNAIPIEHENGRKEVVTRLLSGQIHNTKMDDKSISRLAFTIDKKAQDKTRIKEAVDKEIEKDDRKSKYSELKDSLTKEPEKTPQLIADLLISSKEKLDINELRKINEESKKIDKKEDSQKDIDKKDKSYELKEDELRNLVLSRNAYAVSHLDKMNIKLPEGIRFNEEKYKNTLNMLNERKEKNELIRLAALSSSFTREKDGQTLERVVLGKPEQKETVEKIMTYSPKGTNFNERYEDIRNFTKEITRPEPDKPLEKEREKEELRLPDLKNCDAKQAATEISKYFGTLCKDESYSRGKVLDDLQTIKQDIKKYNVDLQSLDGKDRCLRDIDVTRIVSKDPQLIVDLQKMGIALSKNGDANVERLQSRIDLIKQVSPENDTLRMGILSTCLTKSNNTSVSVQNPFNLMDAEKNKSAKEIAIAIVAEEKNIKLSNPVKLDEKDAEKLSQAKIDLKEYEKFKTFEKDIKETIVDRFSDSKRDESLRQIATDYIQKDFSNSDILSILYSDKTKEHLSFMIEYLEKEDTKKDILEKHPNTSTSYEDKLEKLKNFTNSISNLQEKEINVTSPFSNCIDLRGKETSQNPLANIIIAQEYGFDVRNNLSGNILKEYDAIRQQCQDARENISNINILSDDKVNVPIELISDTLKGINYDSCIELLKDKETIIDNMYDKDSSLYKNALLTLADSIGYLEKFDSHKIIDEKTGNNDEYRFIEKGGFEKIQSDMEKLLSISHGDSLQQIKETYTSLLDYDGKEREELLGAAYPPNASFVKSENIRTINLSPSDFHKFEEIRDDLKNNVAKISIDYPSYEREHGNGIIEIIGLSDYNLSQLSDEKLEMLRSICPDIPEKTYSNEEKEIYGIVNNFFVEAGSLANGDNVNLNMYDNFMRSIEEANEKYSGNPIYDSTREDISYLKTYVAEIHEGLNKEYEKLDSLRKEQEAREEEAFRDAQQQPDPDYSYVDLDDERIIYEEQQELSYKKYEADTYATAQTMLNTENDRFEYAVELKEFYEDILRTQSDFTEQLRIYVPTDDTTTLSMFYDFKSDSVIIKQTEYNVDDSSTEERIILTYNGEENYPDEFWTNPLSTDIVSTDVWKNFFDEVQRIKEETISSLEEKNEELKTSSTKENDISNMRSTSDIKERLNTYYLNRDDSPDIDAERVFEEAEHALLNIQMLEEIKTGRINEDLKPDPEGYPIYSEGEVDSIICSWFNIEK